MQVARGVIASRCGRAAAADKCFERATVERGEGRRSYMDTWFTVRPALERLHLGAPRDEIAAQLDGVDAEYASRGLAGMQAWLGAIRSIHAL